MTPFSLSYLNQMFIRKMCEGELDNALGKTVIIVDEVDDLVVNENPNSNYVKEDADFTPDLRKCFQSLRRDEPVMPRGVKKAEIWQFAMRAKKEALQKKEGKDYRIVEENGKRVAVILVNGVIPKVRLAATWLQYLNYTLSGTEAVSESPFATVCTPYVFNKYRAIFGLSGSVGGPAELKYLADTYGAIKFEVPQFLDTCTGDAKKDRRNLGVELVDGRQRLIARVVNLCEEYVRKVPVLVVTSGRDEMSEVINACKNSNKIVADEVQRFAMFDADGRSMKDEWETIIADATKRLGGAADNRCRVTVTDRFGGRGHDYQVMDKDANVNGGMLVIATSVPDEREWIQWRGRTARQDRPGQFIVVLNKQASPFTESPHLLSELMHQNDGPTRLKTLLLQQDESIGETHSPTMLPSPTQPSRPSNLLTHLSCTQARLSRSTPSIRSSACRSTS